jgi:hypothetical protein
MATTGRFFPVQTMHLGQTGTFAGYNESDVVIGPRGFSLPDGQLGMVVEDNGKVYRKVQHTASPDAVATAAGFVAYWKTRASVIATSDQEDSEAAVNGVCGAYLGVITAGNFCFVQIGGLQSIGSKDATSAGDMLFGSTTDGQMATVAAGSAVLNIPFAIAWGTAAANFVNAYWLLGNLL